MRITLTALCECGWTYSTWVQSDILTMLRYHRRSCTYSTWVQSDILTMLRYHRHNLRGYY